MTDSMIREYEYHIEYKNYIRNNETLSYIFDVWKNIKCSRCNTNCNIDNIKQYFGYNTFGKRYQRCFECRNKIKTLQHTTEQLDKAKQYNEHHKEYHTEQSKQWSDLNKEHLTEVITCNLCYDEIQRRRMTAHLKTMKCKYYQ